MTVPQAVATQNGSGHAPAVTAMRVRSQDILGRFRRNGWTPGYEDPTAVQEAYHQVSRAATNAGMSLTAYLERLDPSGEYNSTDGDLQHLDAFERQLRWAGIRVKSDPVKGLWADPVERFWLSDQPASPILYPEFINRTMRVPLIAPPILDEMVAVTTPVDSNSYRTIYLADSVAQRRMGRVTETADLPKLRLTTSERSIQLYKYGAAIEGSYEAFRRVRIDLFAIQLGRIALQSQLDKAATALATVVNGDGNSGTGATNYNLTTLDAGATAGNLTYKAWLRWGLKLWPYMINTVIAGEAELLSILTLQFPNINPLMILSMLTSGQPVDMKLELGQNLWTTIRLVFLASAPSNVLTGINKQTALEMVTEVGSNITETDKVITKQFNVITVTETVGFGVMFPQATTTLTLNA